jgi:hypothetical protein
MNVTRLRELVPYVFLALVAAAIAVGFLQGIALAVLLLAALAFGLAIWLMSSSVRGLSGDTPLSLDEALGLGAPSAEEEQKRAVLRALKDLEYERSVGKISEDDYHEFSARYREEARRLISLVDETMVAGREAAEKLLAERVQAAGLAEPGAVNQTDDEPASAKGTEREQSEPIVDGEDATETAEPSDAADDEPSCVKCGTTNDADARFCKNCGAAIGERSPAEAKQERPSEEKAS